MATAAVADAAAAAVTSAMTSTVVAAASATATAGLNSAGNHIFAQILVSGIVDPGFFAIDILIYRSSILSLGLL